MNLDELKKYLTSAWSEETCVLSLRSQWNKNNPSLGQCAITSLIVNDMFGGKIMRCLSETGSHYYNMVDGVIIDLTAMQFLNEKPYYETGEERTREYLLGNIDTKERYLMLSKKLRDEIAISEKNSLKLSL